MITCNHDPVRLLKTGMSFDGNVSCHRIRTKGFGSRILLKNTRDDTLWQFIRFLSKKKSSGVQFVYLQSFLGENFVQTEQFTTWSLATLAVNDKVSPLLQRADRTKLYSRRTHVIMFRRHVCHMSISLTVSRSPSSGAGKREPRALSWLDLTIAEIFRDARRNKISGTQEIRLRYAHDSRESIVCAKRQQTNLLHEPVLIANKAQRKIKTSKRAKELYWHYTATN